MKRLLLVALFAVGCSGPDEKTEQAEVAEQPRAEAPATNDPLAAANGWAKSDAAASFAAILGDAPVVERLWAEGSEYRALLTSSGASAEAKGVKLSLRADGPSWSVVDASEASASELWPAL